MDVRLVSDEALEQHGVGELEQLLARDDGLVWVDIPVGDDEAARVLREVFGFHPLAVQACIERNAVPKVRAYERRQAVQRHAPGGEGGISHGLTGLFLFLQNVPSEPMAAPALVGGRPRSMRNRGHSPRPQPSTGACYPVSWSACRNRILAASTGLWCLVGRVVGA